MREPYDSREGEKPLECPKCGSTNVFTFNKEKKWNTQKAFCKECKHKSNIDDFS